MENIYVKYIYIKLTSKIVESIKINYIPQCTQENVNIKDTKAEEVERPLDDYDFVVNIIIINSKTIIVLILIKTEFAKSI